VGTNRPIIKAPQFFHPLCIHPRTACLLPIDHTGLTLPYLPLRPLPPPSPVSN
jgi:hypothetical protein